MMVSVASLRRNEALPPATGITRSPGLRPVGVLPADRLAELLASARARAGAPGRILLADLGLGGWRGHHAARELFDAAGLAFPEPARPPRAASGFSYAGLISRGIDAEARGNGVALRALELAVALVECLHAHAPVSVLVIAPRFGIALGADNRWFLQFLEQGLGEGPHRFALVCGGPPPPDLPPAWRLEAAPSTESAAREAMPDGRSRLLALVPGMLTPSLLAELDLAEAAPALIEMGESYLVPPSARRPPAEAARFDFDDLAAASKGVAWLRCYAQIHGNNFFVEPAFLAEQAWQSFGQGANDIALLLLDRAIACERAPDARDALRAQQQGMRIAMHRFADAAKAGAPSGSVTGIGNFLVKAKGWSLVMSGAAAAGRRFLADARAFPGTVAAGSIDDLYLRNITALAEARVGNPDEALRLEQEITAENGRSEPFDWQLHYVNMVNTARLLRAAGRLDEAREAYMAAFATGAGNLSESDRVYDEACLARLAAERGRPDLAMQHWLRAALAFAAARVPEALAPRCVAMLLAKRSGADDDVTEAVAGVLGDALLAADAELSPGRCRLAGEFSDESGVVPAPTFMFADTLSCRPCEIFGAIGAEGWSVIAVRSPAHLAFDGLRHRRLRRLLARLIGRAIPADAASGFSTFVVDARHGRPIASNEVEQVESCIGLGLSCSVFEDRKTRLAAASIEALQQASRLRLGPLVRQVEFAEGSARVVFKRYLGERREDDRYGVIAAAAAGDSTVGAVTAAADRASSAEICGRIRSLEQARIVCRELPAPWRKLTEGGAS